MSIVDIGANLGNKAFHGDLDAVLARALDAGVTAIVATGTSVEGSRRAWEIAERERSRSPKLWSTAGIHPHNAKTFGPDTRIALRELAAREEVVAIGECGLDFDRDFSPRDLQVKAFRAQLELAAELGMPVFLHERAAHAAFVEILGEMRPRLSRAVVHCFTGTESELDRYLALDCHIGLTGWLCDDRRGAHLAAFIGKIPTDRLMIETDAPYILPRDMRPKPKSGRNEPAYLPHVLAAVARARGTTPEALAEATSATATRFFDLT
ncbi:MAG: TatD family hydrolase [Deltaproteobacteria bacterium]|nr:TatD family hydrolase [Deltaproteobacteria bacterium]